MKKILSFLMIIIGLSPVFAQTLFHPWSTIGVGGMRDSSAGFSLHGTAGDPVLSTDTTGGFSFFSGYLPGESYITGTFVVTNTNNSGPGSLKQAILDANAQTGLDYITFNISPGGIQTIQPDSVLPEIIDPVILDGTTQPGFAGTPIIEIDATNAGVRSFSCGIISIAASYVTIRGLVINNAIQTDAVCINSYAGYYTTQYNNIEGCYIGTDVTGRVAKPNAGNAISIVGASYNRIGGETSAHRNVLSGNVTLGVRLLGAGAIGNIIQGNYIGVNATGDSALPNQLGGIAGQGDTNTVIGGMTPGARNIISGNGYYGLGTEFGYGYSIFGNYIGTDVTGTRAIGNGGVGISIAGTPNTHIGGSASGSANVISGNSGAGIQIIQARGIIVEGNSIGTNALEDTAIGNSLHGIFVNSWFDTTNLTIRNNVIGGNGGDGIHVGNTNVAGNVILGNHVGTDVTGTRRLGNIGNGIVTNFSSFYQIGGSNSSEGNTVAFNGQHGILISNTGVDTSNSITRNSIYGNGYLGIKLGGLEYEPTPNDSLDPDPGPNNNQNYPSLTFAEGDSFNVHVVGTLNSRPNETFTLEFFSNDSADASGYGEGKDYIGSTTVSTNAAGIATFSFDGDYSKSPGNTITATATDSTGNTSEFSQAVMVTQTAPTLAVKDVSVLEGNSSSVLASFSISLEPVSEDTVRVQFMTVDGEATVAGGDYNDTSGALTFAPGENQKIVSVAVYGDAINEVDEQFYLRIHSVNNAIIGDSLAFCLITDDDSIQTFQYNFSAGWNLVSMPITLSDSLKLSIFPTASSNAYSFETSGGYTRNDTLRNGTGYWLKFPAPTIVTLTGVPLVTIEIPVFKGWNMIGSIAYPLIVTDVASLPGGLITSQFYGYNHGYAIVDSIEPARGYWVKVSQTGTLILSLAGAQSSVNSIQILPTTELPPPIPGDENSNNSIIPGEYKLSQNYPNPFNPVTIIYYQLPVDCHVSLKVYNVLGEEAAALVNDIQYAGYKSVNWNANDAPSGVYFYRLQAGAFSDMKKMLLLR